MTEIVRSVKENEYDLCLDLWDQAFERTPRDYFEKYFDGDPWFKPEYARVCVDDGRLMSAVHIVRREVRIGKTRLTMGGIANVGTPPEYRGKGYSSKCMNSSIEVMEKDGFDFSMLSTGINPFYERFGWSTVPMDYTAGNLREKLPATSGRYTIRSYNPDSDAGSLVDVYNTFSRDIVLSVARTVEYWNGYCRVAPEKISMALAKDGNVAGYIIGGNHWDTPVIQELVYLSDHSACVNDLLLSFTSSLLESGKTRVIAMLPLAIPIASALDAVLSGKEPMTFNNHMFRIIDPERLMEKMLIEFSDRAVKAGVSGSIAIDTGMGSVGLKVEHGGVELIDESACRESVKLSQSEFFRLLFGIKEPEGSKLMKVLFPKRPWMYFAADHF